MSIQDEFPGLLYNRLWENVIQKENRLWTFLSVYGAAVGIVIGTSVADSHIKIEASFVILVLTYWAAELILDSDWWSVRNRLMIQQLEVDAKAHNKGWIPTYYRGSRYAPESVTRVCLTVFSLVGLATFWLAVSQLGGETDFTARAKATWLCLLYAAAVLATVRCEHVRETQLKQYYDMVANLSEQRKKIGAETPPLNRQEDEKRDRHARTGRLQILLIYVVLSGIVWLRFDKEIRDVGAAWFFVLVGCVAAWFLYFAYAFAHARLIDRAAAGNDMRKYDGKDAGFLLVDRHADTGRVHIPRPLCAWVISNWILLAFFTASVAYLWFAIDSYPAKLSDLTYLGKPAR